MRLGRPLKNHTCEQGLASSMWPRRSRRTRDSVTSTPHLSQITPRCFMRLYLPHKHSQSAIGSENAGAEQAVALRLEGPVIDGFGLGYFAVRPAPDFLRRGQTDSNRIEVGDQIRSIVWRRSVHLNASVKSSRQKPHSKTADHQLNLPNGTRVPHVPSAPDLRPSVF